MDNQQSSLDKTQQQQLLFMMLVQQHQQIAMMGMGKIPNPGTGTIQKEMSSARYAIDTLAMLQDYTQGNLSQESSDYLSHVLNTLRLNYVDEINAPTETVADSDADDEDVMSDSEADPV